MSADRQSGFVHTDHARYFDLNFIAYAPRGLHAGSRTSSFILDEAFSALPMDTAWKAVIQRIQRESGVGQTVWGIKQEGGRYSLEFYFYYPRRSETHTYEHLKAMLAPFLAKPFAAAVEMGDYHCLSFNLEASQVSGLNVYYIDDYREASSIKAYSWFLPVGSPVMQKMNTYHALLTESGFHEDGFHFSDASRKVEECCRKLFPGEDASLANFYRDYAYLQADGAYLVPVGVAEKAGAAGLYFMGLSVGQFIDFLVTHAYPVVLVARLVAEKNNLAHMRYDVGVDFYLERGRVCIKKTAFFGSV